MIMRLNCSAISTFDPSRLPGTKAVAMEASSTSEMVRSPASTVWPNMVP